TLPRGNAVTFDYEPEHRLEENFHLLDFTHSPSHEPGVAGTGATNKTRVRPEIVAFKSIPGSRAAIGNAVPTVLWWTKAGETPANQDISRNRSRADKVKYQYDGKVPSFNRRVHSILAQRYSGP
ncbi:MAG: hypothetical protein M0Z50_13055, partial [Planctomycetia bacterium]|nr:hypothetical protein [Planctomycetia bacterium]